jgi:uncharacterized protein YndB with AHSA1/START domain
MGGVIDVQKDLAGRTLVVVSEFAAPAEHVWELWRDPRKLERWWGPPGYPATFTTYELEPGGAVAYYMTGPEGQRFHGWWTVTAVDAPAGLSFLDGFANEDGSRNEDLPTTEGRVEITSREGGGSRMTITSVYPTTEAMQQVLDMGMEQGITMAIGQMDGLLAELA